jgi:hypothetical protein
MWAVMHPFVHENIPDELNGSKIHRLKNVMTLVPQFHSLFDKFKFWFVSTVRPNYYSRLPDDADMLFTNDNWQNEENKYKLDSPLDGIFAREFPEYVTFTAAGLHSFRY